MTGSYGSYPDEVYDRKALPEIKLRNKLQRYSADIVTDSARPEGIQNDPFTGICISNVRTSLTEKPEELQWNCTDIQGISSKVTRQPCPASGRKASGVLSLKIDRRLRMFSSKLVRLVAKNIPRYFSHDDDISLRATKIRG
ncbi:hypothetical protein POTOM_015355 [Populus tomentosa]|uniref:Uncharacterized protein n=1 Tax=Populus tomentosa TaxID=118781 RepID=A0A8X8A1P0_POPTO|nr:hypothetical protein POTOM_015355 [Populus tomentosa]